MKYYSDVTKGMYDSVEACEEAEEKALNANNERKIAAAEVEKARKDMEKAKQTYYKVLSNFCSKYGYYHHTITGEDAENWKSLADIFSDIFNL